MAQQHTLHTHGEVSAAALGCASDPAAACAAGASATAVEAALGARGLRLLVPAAALVLAMPPAAAFVLVAPVVAVAPAAALVAVDLPRAVVALGFLAACRHDSLSACNPAAGCISLRYGAVAHRLSQPSPDVMLKVVPVRAPNTALLLVS